MKKNITINLFGSLYAIDEDAYELLEKYLDNMKRYFSKRDGGDEIADDIEHRVAELFSEIKSNGAEAVSIEDVQAIIKRIGNPEDMDDDASDENNERDNAFTEEKNSDNNSKWNSFKGRKLYRNPDNQVIGGVLSGLCTYFGGNDPLPWRIIFVILAILTQIFPFFIFYLILWAIMPMAVTSEEKLKMKGKPVNVDTLNEEIMTDAVKTDKSKIKGIFNTLITIIGFCLKLFIGFFIGLLLFATLITAICLAVGALTPFSLTGFDSEGAGFISRCIVDNPQIVTLTWISVVAAIIFLGIVLYSIIHSIIKKNTNEHMGAFTRISIVIIAILSLIACITSGISTYNIISNSVSEHNRTYNTRNGVYLSDNQHERLSANGWKIISYENASDRIYRSVISFIDDDRNDYVLSFKRYDTEKPMKVNLQRAEDFPAGNYHIEAIACAKCNGAYVYAKNDSTMYTWTMIPADESFDKGNMKNMSDEELRKTVFFDFDPSDEIWDDDHFREILTYWSYVRSESFYHKGGTINAGVTNMGSVTGGKDSSNPAWNFTLRQIKIVAD